jgi:hypothetical protein
MSDPVYTPVRHQMLREVKAEKIQATLDVGHFRYRRTNGVALLKDETDALRSFSHEGLIDQREGYSFYATRGVRLRTEGSVLLLEWEESQ